MACLTFWRGVCAQSGGGGAEFLIAIPSFSRGTSLDLNCRRGLKLEVRLKITPLVQVECAGQLQPVVLDAVD